MSMAVQLGCAQHERRRPKHSKFASVSDERAGIANPASTEFVMPTIQSNNPVPQTGQSQSAPMMFPSGGENLALQEEAAPPGLAEEHYIGSPTTVE